MIEFLMIGFLIAAIVCFIICGVAIFGKPNTKPRNTSVIIFYISLSLSILFLSLFFVSADFVSTPSCQLIEVHTEIVAGETILVSTSQCENKDGEIYEDIEIEVIEVTK